MLGNLTTGFPVSGARDDTAWVAVHTWSWIWAAHDRLDRGQQSKDFTNMRGILSLRRDSAAVTSLSCLPIPRKESCIIHFQRHRHVQPLLLRLRQVMYLSVFASSDEKFGYDY